MKPTVGTLGAKAGEFMMAHTHPNLGNPPTLIF